MIRSFISRFAYCMLCGLFTAFLTFSISGCQKKKKIPVSHLVITTVPENTDVYIQGKKFGKKLKVRPRTYILKFSCPNYKDAWIRVEALADKKIKIHQVMNPATSDILITSKPDRAAVRFQGKNVGSTPLLLRDLPYGSYQAELIRNGYTSRTITWNIQSPSPKKIHADLVSNMGILSITSIPRNADVLIDGKKAGTTPFKEEIESGKHDIQLQSNGYASVYRTIFITSRQITTLHNLKMQIRQGGLYVSSTPSAASITVNGTPYGDTPLNLPDLAPGKYKIVLQKEKYDPVERTITIIPGQKKDLHFKMDPNTGGIDIVTFPSGIEIFVDGRPVGTSPKTKDPNSTSIFHLRSVSQGEHRVSIFHKRSIPPSRKITVYVKKGEVVRTKPLKLWIPNAKVTYLHDNSVEEGRMIREEPDGYFFEPEPGVRKKLRKNSVKVVSLDDKE